MNKHYTIQVQQTRTIFVKIEAQSPNQAVALVATEYDDNRHSALANDEDWQIIETSFRYMEDNLESL